MIGPSQAVGGLLDMASPGVATGAPVAFLTCLEAACAGCDICTVGPAGAGACPVQPCKLGALGMHRLCPHPCTWEDLGGTSGVFL